MNGCERGKISRVGTPHHGCLCHPVSKILNLAREISHRDHMSTLKARNIRAVVDLLFADITPSSTHSAESLQPLSALPTPVRGQGRWISVCHEARMNERKYQRDQT